ncbi:prolipoprotein diacylglyceryl transferase [Granulicella cerasi]|uniref:Prolipoprotein diacylglyceryl transferase n=1 Tax=Granulicella cerasi TaxID=741063 RepID=A0ABW1Z9J2_9BACT|nr:prolipoprotein diacylglyceryl transferase [Granulicella cerasi]
MSFLPKPELHPVFETLAYVVGYRVYKHLRAQQGDRLNDEHRWLIIAAAAVGALVGARLLGIAEDAPQLGFHGRAFFAMSGGKTIVGGLLGGWLVVEAAKWMLHIRSRTGDLFAVPLALGIAIGRIGCFFAGLADDTYGKPTSLPWGVNFGDGIPRHPTQLYELVFLLALAWALHRFNAKPHREGRTFRLFLLAYLAWRFAIDFLKPRPMAGALNVIQWACLAGVIALALGEFGHKQQPHAHATQELDA